MEVGVGCVDNDVDTDVQTYTQAKKSKTLISMKVPGPQTVNSEHRKILLSQDGTESLNKR